MTDNILQELLRQPGADFKPHGTEVIGVAPCRAIAFALRNIAAAINTLLDPKLLLSPEASKMLCHELAELEAATQALQRKLKPNIL